MTRWIAAPALMMLAACNGANWPEAMFPQQVEVERTLYSDASSGLREGCVAIVVELDERSAKRLMGTSAPAAGWIASPVPEDAKPLAAFSALGGCGTGQGAPLGDMSGALHRPGAWYRIVNGGEGLAVIVPRARLAGWYYAG